MAISPKPTSGLPWTRATSCHEVISGNARTRLIRSSVSSSGDCVPPVRMGNVQPDVILQSSDRRASKAPRAICRCDNTFTIQ